MNIKKILKFYLVLTLVLTAVSALSYTDGFRQYLSAYGTSVLNYKYLESKPYAPFNNMNLSQGAAGDIYFYKENPANIFFNMTNDSTKSIVPPGTKGAEIMQLNFKSGTPYTELQNLRFTVAGIDEKSIERAFLMVKDKIVAEASISTDSLKFYNINYKFEKDAYTTLSLKLDLSANLRAGNRIRLDIADPSDINLAVDGVSYAVNSYYPIRGKYLSISRAL